MVPKSRNLIQAQGLIQKNNLDAYTNVKENFTHLHDYVLYAR